MEKYILGGWALGSAKIPAGPHIAWGWWRFPNWEYQTASTGMLAKCNSRWSVLVIYEPHLLYRY